MLSRSQSRLPANGQIVTHSDSIFTTPDLAHAIPAVVASLTGFYNRAFAFNGWTIANMIADYPTMGGVSFSSARKKNILILEGGVNDIAAGATAATALSRMATLYAMGVASGYHVIVCTDIANGTLNASNHQARLDYNTGIRAAYSGLHLCDLNAVPHFDETGSNGANTTGVFTNTTYYNVDKAHLTETGAATLGAVLAAVVNQVNRSAPVLGDMAGQDSGAVHITGGQIVCSTIEGTTSGSFGFIHGRTQTFASYATEGFRFIDDAGAMSGGMVEVETFGLILFYASNLNGGWSWRDPSGTVLMNLGNTGGLVVGTLTTLAFRPRYHEVSATYAMAVNDFTVNCTSGTFTVTLPDAAAVFETFSGQIFVLRNSGVGVITPATTGGQTINGTTPVALTAGQTAIYQSTGTNWITLK